MGHGKLAVNCFLAKIIRSLKAKHRTIDSIDLFSDDASSQFNQFQLVNLAFLRELVSLNPTELLRNAYGKGVTEDIGGDTT